MVNPPTIALDPLPNPVAYGATTTLRATVVGPPANTPVTFYRRGGGVEGIVGQALTNASGVAALATTATGNAEYWAQLNSAFGAKPSQVQAQSVTPAVGLTAKKKGKKKYEFTATLTPGIGGGQALLQRFDKKKGWVTVKSASPAASLTWKLKPPKGKSRWRVLLPASVDFAAGGEQRGEGEAQEEDSNT